MKRNEVPALLFQIKKLVYIWNVGARYDPRSPSVGVMRPHVPLGSPVEHRLSHHSFEHHYHTDRAPVIVDGSPLAWLPAQQQHLGVLAPHHQVPGIFMIGEK